MNKQFSVTWVRLIEDATMIESHDPIQNTHLFITVGCFAKVSFQLQIKDLFGFALISLEITASTQSREIISMNDDSYIAVSVMEAAG